MPFLIAADNLSRLTLPELNPSGNVNGSQSNYSGPFRHDLEQPYSSVGTTAITGLGATLLGILFPVNVPWHELQIEVPLGREITGEGQTALDEVLVTIERRISDRLDRHQYKAILLQALYRVLVEGQVVIHRLPSGRGLRHIPLRSFVVERFAGQVQFIVIKESLKDREGNESDLYTLVDYDKDEVWQQRRDEEPKQVGGVHAGDYILATTSIPDHDNYVYGYSSRFFGSLHHINSLQHDLIRASNIAAKSVMFLQEGSGLQPEMLARMRPGQVFMGDPQAIQWLTVEGKISDWAWVQEAVDRQAFELNKNFALSLSQRPDLVRDRQTAESVRRLAQELDSAVGAVAQVLQMTLQRPLAEAYLRDVLAEAQIPELEDDMKVVVTSGASALSRLSELQQLFILLEKFLADPSFQQRVDTVEIFSHAAKVIGVPVSDFIREPAQAPVQQTVQQ